VALCLGRNLEIWYCWRAGEGTRDSQDAVSQRGHGEEPQAERRREIRRSALSERTASPRRSRRHNRRTGPDQRRQERIFELGQLHAGSILQVRLPSSSPPLQIRAFPNQLPRWPVIGIMIVGGLILFSVIWCVSRCLCCGLSCCCECCYCLKCCGNCCGCCDPPRGRKHKYLDEPFVPPHHAAGGYKAHEPMAAGPPPGPSPFSPSPFPPARSTEHVAGPPQYAEFEVGKKAGAAAGGHEDALPVMPTWESAGSKKVLVEEEEVEMNQLKKPEASNTAGQNVPLMAGAGAVPGPVSPIPSPDHRSPYSPPAALGANGGYVGASATDPYTAGGRGYNNFSGPGAYGQSQTSLGPDQGYGMAGAAMAGPGRRSPHDYNNNGYGQVPHNQDGYQDSYSQDQGYPPSRPAAAGYNSYSTGRQDSYSDYNQPSPNQGYAARGPGMRSPPPAGTYPQERLGRTPPPRAAEYGGARTYSPAPMMPQQQQPQRQHTYEMPAVSQPVAQRQPTYEMPAEPVVAASESSSNTGGFDFGAGYSRPQQAPAGGRQEMTAQQQDQGYGSSRPARGQGQQGGAYPGYRGYNAGQQGAQQGWSGV